MGPKEVGRVADERLPSGFMIDAETEIDDIEMDDIVGLESEIVSMLRLVRGMLRVVDKDGTSTLMLTLEDVIRLLRDGTSTLMLTLEEVKRWVRDVDTVGRLVSVGSVE